MLRGAACCPASSTRTRTCRSPGRGPPSTASGSPGSATARSSAAASAAAASADAPRSARTLVAAAAEQTPEGGLGRAHLRLIDDAGGIGQGLGAGVKTLTKAAGDQIQPGGAVKSDGCSAYRAPSAESTPQAAGEPLPSGAHRHPPTSRAGDSTSSRASAPRTCSPASTSSASGSGRRDQRLDLLRRILKRCILYTPPVTYSQLIAASVEGMVSQ